MIYLAGPVSGEADYFATFAKYADQLRQDGHGVYNPAAANLEGMPLDRIMAHLLPQLCACNAIAMIPGWRKSGGARIEFRLARYLGLSVIFL